MKHHEIKEQQERERAGILNDIRNKPKVKTKPIKAKKEFVDTFLFTLLHQGSFIMGVVFLVLALKHCGGAK